MKAFLTFKFQRVFCPLKKKEVLVNDIETCEYGQKLLKFTDHTFLGMYLITNIKYYREHDEETSQKIALGEIDPITLKPYEHTENDNLAVEKVMKKSSFYVKKVYDNSKDEPMEMPLCLKNNPDSEYTKLWK